MLKHIKEAVDRMSKHTIEESRIEPDAFTLTTGKKSLNLRRTFKFQMTGEYHASQTLRTTFSC